jgi:glycosyltransferase involved in cell wall biosynthesis
MWGKLMTLVSVIITNYNYEKYIAEAIQSVLEQTYTDYEIIVVDDGSTDSSLQIIDEIQKENPDVMKVIAQKNKGQASAFNVGFEFANGEILAFLDADDYWYPNKLETIVKYHNLYPAIQHNLNVNKEEKITILEDKVQKQQYAWENYGFAGFIPTSGLSFLKKAVQFVFPIKDDGYKVCADWYLKSMFLNELDIFSLNESLGVYRSHGSNNWYLNKDKYSGYGAFILNQSNIYRAKKGKKMILSDAGENIKEYLYSTMKLEKSKQYTIFGTGQLAKYFYNQMRYDYDVIGFTNSFVNEKIEFEGLCCKPLQNIVSNLSNTDRIIIASDSLGEIEYLLNQLGVKKEIIISPEL